MPDDKVRALAKNVRRELVKFRLLPDAGWIGGVCAAIAYRLGVPTWIVRLVWGGLFLCKGVGLILYLILWFFVPNARTPADYGRRTGDTD